MEECGVDASEGSNNIDRRTKIFDEQLSIANQKKAVCYKTLSGWTEHDGALSA